MIGYTEAASNGFWDVPAGAWYEDAVLKLVAAGTLTGNGDGSMSPDAYMTREEAMTMLARAYGLKVENTQAGITQYSDYASVSDYATGYVGAMTAAGYVSGYEDGTIRPQASISRAEFVKILDNMIKLYITEPGTYGPGYYGGIAMVKAGGVTLNGIVANGAVVSPQVGGTIDLQNCQFSGNVVNLSSSANVTSNNSSNANGTVLPGTIMSGNGGGPGSGPGGPSNSSSVSVKFYNGTALYATRNVTRGSYLKSLPADPTVKGKVFVGWFETQAEADNALNSTEIDFASRRISRAINVYAGFAAEGEVPTATPSADEPTATPLIDKPTATPAEDEPTATPAAEEPTATPIYSEWSQGQAKPDTTDGSMKIVEFEGKTALDITGRNVYKILDEAVNAGVLSFTTNVYVGADTTAFRIYLENAEAGVDQNADKAVQAIYSDAGSKLVSGTQEFAIAGAASGWYNVEISADYDKVGEADFITVAVKNPAGETVLTSTMAAANGIENGIKQIRLISRGTAGESDVYFADMNLEITAPKPGVDDPIVAQEIAKLWTAADNYDELWSKAADTSDPYKFNIDDMNMDNLFLRSSTGKLINYEDVVAKENGSAMAFIDSENPGSYKFADGVIVPAKVLNFRVGTELEFIPSAAKNGKLKLYYKGQTAGTSIVTVTQGDTTTTGVIGEDGEIVEVDVKAGENVVIKSDVFGWLAAVSYIPNGEGLATPDPDKTPAPTKTPAPVQTEAPTSEPVVIPDTTPAPVPTAAAENVITVDGSKETNAESKMFKTVTEALTYAQSMNSHASEADRIEINVVPGTYREQLQITVPYLTIQKAEGTDGEVLFTWYYGIGYLYYSTGSDGFYSKEAYETNKAAGTVVENVGVNRWGCATRLNAHDFIAKDIIFENSFNRYVTDEEIEDGVKPAPVGGVYTDTGGKPERTKNSNVYLKSATERAAAIAIEDDTDRTAFYNCKFLSSQDTVYSGSKANRIYFNNCTIQGQTDYIFGGNTLVFDNCNFAWAGYAGEGAGGHVTAVRNSSTDKGYLLYGGQVVNGDMQNGIYAAGDFGRPWGGKDSPTAAIGVKIAAPFAANGWSDWSSKAKESKYYEYGSTDENGNMIDLSNRNCLVPSKWEALAFNPYAYLIKEGDNWDPMGAKAVWEPVIADMAALAIPESDTIKTVASAADSYEVSGNFALPTELAGYEIHFETESLYLNIKDDNTVEVVRPIEGTNEAVIKAYIRKSDSKLVGASKDIKITITADNTVDPEPFKISMAAAKAEIAKSLGTPDADTGEYVLSRTVPVPAVAEADGVKTNIAFTASGNVNANGTIKRNPYASGNAVGKIDYVIECIKGNSLLRETVSYNVVIPPMGADLLYADFEDGVTEVGGKLTDAEGGNNSGYGVTGAVSGTPKAATKDNVIYSFDVKGNAETTLKINKGAAAYLTVTVPASALSSEWNTVEVNVTKDAAVCKVNGTEVTGAAAADGTIGGTSELGTISLSNGTYDNIRVIDGVFNDGSKVYTSFWKASADDKDALQGTMLMRGMTLMADANSCNATDVTLDGEKFSYYVSNSGANGGWTGGTAKDGGIGLKFVAPADGQWTVYVTDLGSTKTFYIGSPDEEKSVVGSAGKNQFLTIGVKAGQTYYATVADSKGRFLGAKYVPTEEGGAALDPDANRKYTTTWEFGSKIWGSKNISGADQIEEYTSANTDSLRDSDKTAIVDPTNGNFDNSSRTDEWCGWGNGSKISVPVVNGSIVTVKVYYPGDTFTINNVAFGSFSGTDNVVSYTYIGDSGKIDVVSTAGGFISYIKVESPVKPQKFEAVESDISYVCDPADSVEFAAENAAKGTAGATVTFSASAKAGYSISDVKVLDASDDTNMSAAGLIDNKDGTWSFTMPAKAVKIKVTTVGSAVVSGTISGIEAADAELVKLYLKEGKEMTQVAVQEDGTYSVELISGKTYNIFGLIGGTNAYTLDKAAITTDDAPTFNIGATAVTAEPKTGTKTYDFTQPNTVVPGTEQKYFNMQNFVTSDGIVSFNDPLGNLRYYNTHGITMSAATIKIAVAGDSEINFSACAYANATMTAVTSGITPTGEVSMKGSSDGANVTFNYTGDAAVLEFRYTGSYLHGISVKTTGGADPSVTPAPKPTTVDYAFDFTNLSTKVGTEYGIFTADEITNTTAKNFALDKDGKVVDVNAENAAAVFTGIKYHSEQHGLGPGNGTIEVYVPGPVKISYGTCAWGGDVTVTNGSDTVATFSTGTGACWATANAETENVVYGYYNGEATTLTLKGGSYVPYISIKTVDASEIPSDATITFANGADTFEGTLPEKIKDAIGTEVTIPLNRTMYVDGKTLTAWTDGKDNYAPGSTVTLSSDMTLTPVFAENTLMLTGTVVFDFQRKNGAPTLSWQNVQTIYVSQATVGGMPIDVKMDVDTNNGGKIANGSWNDWAQFNTGTKLTVPVNIGSVVTVGDLYEAGKYTIDGEEIETDKTAKSKTSISGGTCEIVVGKPSGSYWRTISVTY